MFKILSINPGSTSTKIAIFENETEIYSKTLRHQKEEIAQYSDIISQAPFRKQIILDALAESGVGLAELSAVVGRGGLVKPISGGTYIVNEALLRDVTTPPMGEHASNLGAILAHQLGSGVNIPAFIVDPVVVDELQDVARISGHPAIKRRSIFHALNQKAVAHRYAISINKKYEELNVIVAHLGGGVSVGAHQKGRVIDVNNALNGDGPFSPERSGGLPAWALAQLCFSGEYTQQEVKKMITGKGGFVAYLGTNDGRTVEEMIESGNSNAQLVNDALIYQINKEIGACAAVLKGNVDAIIITGGLAYSKLIAQGITEAVSFIAEVIIYPGEDEMIALAQGALRVLNGEEDAKVYS